jgi:hypothetical protein
MTTLVQQQCSNELKLHWKKEEGQHSNWVVERLQEGLQKMRVPVLEAERESLKVRQEDLKVQQEGLRKQEAGQHHHQRHRTSDHQQQDLEGRH